MILMSFFWMKDSVVRNSNRCSEVIEAVKLNKFGSVTKIAGEEDLRKRRDVLLTVRITQAKRAGKSVKAGIIEGVK